MGPLSQLMRAMMLRMRTRLIARLRSLWDQSRRKAKRQTYRVRAPGVMLCNC
jgi:hypothetical protein